MDDKALALLVDIWQSIWSYDDGDEVCMPLETRDKIGRFLVAAGKIKPEDFEPMAQPE